MAEPSASRRLAARDGPEAMLASLRSRSMPKARSSAPMACRSYPAAEKALNISMPPVRLELKLPCRLPPASSRMASGAEALSPAT